MDYSILTLFLFISRIGQINCNFDGFSTKQLPNGNLKSMDISSLPSTLDQMWDFCLNSRPCMSIRDCPSYHTCRYIFHPFPQIGEYHF